MPYKNVHYIKIMLELLDDERFIQGCNDSQKLDYFLWLCMAGLTQNTAKNDPQWFKTRFNLIKNITEISQNLDFLSKKFSKMLIKNGIVKFKNFKKIHNPLGKSEGTPKDSQRNAHNINIIRIEYIKIKGWKQEDFSPDDYARTGKAIKTLLFKAKNNPAMVINALKWATQQQWCDWTLETVIKRWPDFNKTSNKPEPTKHNLACPKCKGTGFIYDENNIFRGKCSCRENK